MSLRDALVRSRNVPTVHLATDVGYDAVARLAEDAGLDGRPPAAVDGTGHGVGQPARAGRRVHDVRGPGRGRAAAAGAEGRARQRRRALAGGAAAAAPGALAAGRVHRHGRAARGALARDRLRGRPRRLPRARRGQDRHHQRRDRRLVRRLHAEHAGGGLDRLRQAAAHHGAGDGRTARGARVGSHDAPAEARAIVRARTGRVRPR